MRVHLSSRRRWYRTWRGMIVIGGCISMLLYIMIISRHDPSSRLVTSSTSKLSNRIGDSVNTGGATGGAVGGASQLVPVEVADLRRQLAHSERKLASVLSDKERLAVELYVARVEMNRTRKSTSSSSLMMNTKSSSNTQKIGSALSIMKPQRKDVSPLEEQVRNLQNMLSHMSKKMKEREVSLTLLRGLANLDVSGAAAFIEKNQPQVNRVIMLPLVWMAPFYSGGGYCSEAISYVTELHESNIRLQIVQHGDDISDNFVLGLPDKTKNLLATLSFGGMIKYPPQHSIVVCHSTPEGWEFPVKEFPSCPPAGTLFKIGRTMFETDGLPQGWREKLEQMDEIWVPASFFVETFANAGVPRDKLYVVPEAVDVEEYDPAKVRPVALPTPKLVNGTQYLEADEIYKFLSIFKWEERKGWQFLLEAFLTEFTADEGVALYILSRPYMGVPRSAIQQQLATFIGNTTQILKNMGKPARLPPVILLNHDIPSNLMPSLYKSADAFVIPSRGEGWGRPHVEAMSMELPVIATNWSGPQEYLNEHNGYPLEIDGLEPVSGLFLGGLENNKWARPSVRHLRKLMRHVKENPIEAKLKGKRARQTMLDQYCPECVARVVIDRLKRVQKLILG